MSEWKFTATDRRVVFRTDGPGSCIASALPEGTPIADPDPVVPTLDDFKKAIEDMLQSHAQALDYISWDRLLSHVNSPDPIWRADGEQAWKWKTAIDKRAYDILAEVQAGLRPIPSLPDFIALLPAHPAAK